MASRLVLLVEDNADDVELTLDAFRESRLSGQVDVARDVETATQYLLLAAQKGQGALPALVLLDLKLPRKDGLVLVRRIRSDPSLASLPIVVLTTSSEPEDVAASYAAGANSFIRKPVDYDTFVSLVREIGVYWLLLNENVSTNPNPASVIP